MNINIILSFGTFNLNIMGFVYYTLSLQDYIQYLYDIKNGILLMLGSDVLLSLSLNQYIYFVLLFITFNHKL